MTTDPIADLLTRIRNAELASHSNVLAPYSKIKEELLKILKIHKYIKDYSVAGKVPKKALEIKLIEEKPFKTTYKRISKPGQRIYIKSTKIRPLRSGLGISIFSTSKGILDNIAAKKEKVGGELLCEIW